MPAAANLPVTLDWYRDAFKWFVALAAGILGFSVTLVKDHNVESCWTKIPFFLVCLFFGLSALFGVWAYLWAVKLGNSRENQDIFKGKLSDNPNSPHQAEWETDLSRAEKDAKTAQTYLGISYTVMLYAFLLGVPAFAVLAGSLLLSKKTPIIPPKPQASQVSIFLGEVGPFAPGSISLPEACDKRNDISSIVSQMSRRSSDLDYVLLVGSADHRQVRTGASNRTLAVRRTLWAEYCLRQQLPPPLDSLMMTHSVNGPLNLNTRKEELLAEDRRVGVYAIMKNTSPPSIQDSHQP